MTNGQNFEAQDQRIETGVHRGKEIEIFINNHRIRAYEGETIGAVLAALLSWSVNHSILWALLHAFLSWFYVIYHWIVYGKFLP